MGRTRKIPTDLPSRVYQRRKSFFFSHPDGQWIKLGEDRTEALRVHSKILGLRESEAPLSMLKNTFSYCRKNAKLRGLEMLLNWQDVMSMWMRSGGACEVTGIRFTLYTAKLWHRRPFAPSIDRRDSLIGYTLANCRLVCAAVNVAISEWGDEVFDEIAKSYVALQRKRTSLLDIQNIDSSCVSEKPENQALKLDETTTC